MDAFLERAAARPGERVRLAVRIVLAPGWHVNGARPAEAGLVATTLRAGADAPARLTDVSLPAEGPLAGVIWIRGVLEVPADAARGPRRIGLVLTLQPCDAASCQAARDLALDLPLRFDPEAEPERRHPEVFAD